MWVSSTLKELHGKALSMTSKQLFKTEARQKGLSFEGCRDFESRRLTCIHLMNHFLGKLWQWIRCLGVNSSQLFDISLFDLVYHFQCFLILISSWLLAERTNPDRPIVLAMWKDVKGNELARPAGLPVFLLRSAWWLMLCCQVLREEFGNANVPDRTCSFLKTLFADWVFVFELFRIPSIGARCVSEHAAASSLKAFLAQFPCKGPLRGCFLY